MRIVHPKAEAIVRETVKNYVDFIKPSYGPAGRSVLIKEEHRVRSADDGKIISENYEIEGEYANAVISYIKEATAKTDSKVGDGTTTSGIVMGAVAEGIFEKTSNELTSKKPAFYIKEVETALPEAIKQIKAQVKPVKTKEELYDIALNSSNDEDVAKLISDSIFDIGKDGRLTVQDSPTAETYCEKTDGLEIEKGYATPYLVDRLPNGQPLEKATLKRPYVLLMNKKLESVPEIVPLLKVILQEPNAESRELLIVADGFGDMFLNYMSSHKVTGTMRSILVENPAYGEHKLEFLKDLEAVTGAKVIDEKAGVLLNISSLGLVDSVEANKKTTTITSKGNKSRIKARVDELKAQETGSDYEKDKVMSRIAALVGGMAVIKVGANTQNEQETKKLKVEDAVNSTRLAFKNGKVPGGGRTLEAIKTSSEILNKALKAPRKVLEENGIEFLDEKVFDSADVVIAAVESGISIGLGVADWSGIIATKREKKREQEY